MTESFASFAALLLALHFAAAVACGLAAMWLIRGGRTGLPARIPVLVALLAMAMWAGSVAASGPWSLASCIAESVRNIALVILIHRLFDTAGQRLSLRPIVIVLVGVELVQAMMAILTVLYAPEGSMVMHVSFILRMMVAVGALLLVHNLYAGAGAENRTGLRPIIFGLAGIWAFELNFYVISFLADGPAMEVAAFRGLVLALGALGLILGSRPDAAPIQLRPSRVAALQTISLVLVGCYLIAMIALAELLALFDGDGARLAQVGLLSGAIVLGLIWLPSQRVRALVKVVALKHFFQHRYDYREEWLRFTETIGSESTAESTLNVRILKAVADITDSRSALLFLADEDGRFLEAGYVGQLLASEPGASIPAELALVMETEGDIVDVDAIRAGKDRSGESAHLPDWIRADARCWAIVPLMHFERLVGAILLARPAEERELDWEDFDLLKLVGRQVASYLSEQAGHEALTQSAQFDQFNRRIAFVMHDIKNLASQLNLLASNAERHAEKPAFRADMLITLRTASAKLQNLIDRLGGYRSGQDGTPEPVSLHEVLSHVGKRFESGHQLDIAAPENCIVHAHQEALTQALIHIVQNAFDASEDGVPVNIEVTTDGLQARIEIIDSGEGMDAEFIRTGLYRPFVSSKNGGFGIGAFEARELIRAMGGRMEVTSRKGLGTRFVIILPLSAAAGLLGATHAHEEQQTTPIEKVA